MKIFTFEVFKKIMAGHTKNQKYSFVVVGVAAVLALLWWMGDRNGFMELSSKSLKDLSAQERQALTLNYLSKELQKCDAGSFVGYGQRMLQRFASPTPALTVSAQGSAVKSHGEDYFTSPNFSEEDKMQQMNYLRDRSLTQSIFNNVVTFADLSFHYRSDDINQLNTNFDLLIKSVCYKPELCSETLQSSMRMAYQDYIKALKISEHYQSKDKVVKEINERVSKINHSIRMIEIPEGKVFSKYYGAKIGAVERFSEPEITDQVKDEYHHYQEEYLMQTAQGPGLFLLTDTLRKRVGGLREVPSDILFSRKIQDWNRLRFYVEAHHLIDENDFVNAYAEAERVIATQLKKLIEIQFKKNTTTYPEDFKFLLSTNPVAIANGLLEKPEAVWIVCDGLKGLNEDFKWKKKRDKIWLWGGTVVGGVLLISGVGSILGVSVLAGASATAAITTTSLGLGIAQTSYLAKKSYEAKNQASISLTQSLNGNADPQTMFELDQEMKEYEHLKRDAILVGVATAIIDVPVVVKDVRGVFAAKQTITSLRISKTQLSRAISQKRAQLMQEASGEIIATQKYFQHVYKRTYKEISWVGSGNVKMLPMENVIPKKLKFEMSMNHYEISAHEIKLEVNLGEAQKHMMEVWVPALKKGELDQKVVDQLILGLEKLPKRHVESIDVIRINPLPHAENKFIKGHFAVAETEEHHFVRILDFFPDGFKVESEFYRTLRHEFGHSLAHKMYGDLVAPKEWWEVMLSDQQFILNKKFVVNKNSISKYAGSVEADVQISEDFAESVDKYLELKGGLSSPEIRRQFQNRFQFLDRVFSANLSKIDELMRRNAYGLFSEGGKMVVLRGGALYLMEEQHEKNRPKFN